MSNDELARNADRDGLARRTLLRDCMLKHLAPALVQIEPHGREFVVCDKVVERIVDAHHAHVLGHAQATIAQRGDGPFAIWSFAA